jgi:hypothetical protein
VKLLGPVHRLRLRMIRLDYKEEEEKEETR